VSPSPTTDSTTDVPSAEPDATKQTPQLPTETKPVISTDVSQSTDSPAQPQDSATPEPPTQDEGTTVPEVTVSA